MARVNVLIQDDCLSWILRSFLANVNSSYESGAPRRLEAAEEVKQIIESVGDPKLKAELIDHCERYWK